MYKQVQYHLQHGGPFQVVFKLAFFTIGWRGGFVFCWSSTDPMPVIVSRSHETSFKAGEIRPSARKMLTVGAE
jgi:hypothetical protein